MWSVAKGSCVSWLFSLPCSQERLPEPCRACLVWICEMPANTNEWTTIIAAGDPEPTAEHMRDTLACHRYLPSVTLEARRRGKSLTISFTLDFTLLARIQLLGRSGRGRKATRSRRRLCALHSCWTSTENHKETNDVMISYHANIHVTSTKVPVRPTPNGTRALQLRPSQPWHIL